ncbi:hypothetical protein H0H92_001733, partial [Tricholoma furcatifolium]
MTGPATLDSGVHPRPSPKRSTRIYASPTSHGGTRGDRETASSISAKPSQPIPAIPFQPSHPIPSHPIPSHSSQAIPSHPSQR